LVGGGGRRDGRWHCGQRRTALLPTSRVSKEGAVESRSPCDNNRGGAEATGSDGSDDAVSADSVHREQSRSRARQRWKKYIPMGSCKLRVVNNPGWAKQELPITGSVKRAPVQRWAHGGQQERSSGYRNKRSRALSKGALCGEGISSECGR
jgi:hypothetical protein